MSERVGGERLTIHSDADGLRTALRWLERLLTDAGWGEPQRRDLTLALGEVCANAHRHAYGGVRSGRIDLTAELSGEGVRLSVRDYGRGFAPDVYRTPDLSRPAEGGYGIYLMRKLCDGVEHRAMPVGSLVELSMSRRRDPPAGRSENHDEAR